jgi:two-component system OmpR family sensor kinase
MNSIRRHLLVLLLATLSAGVAVASAAVYLLAREEANNLFDYHLEQVARSLPGRAFAGMDPSQGGEDDADDNVVIQIWDRGGVQLYFSRPSSRLPERAELGFSTVNTPHGAFRVYSSMIGSNVVQVAQPMSLRRQLATDIAVRTVVPLLLLLPVLAFAILMIVGRGLAPLFRIAAEVDARSAEALGPVEEARAPDEVKPLVVALNSLLGRLGRSLAAQRAFVADAAHELRTPLTAVKLQTQLLARAQGEEERAAALQKLEAGVERSARLVEQMLTLARQEPGVERASAPLDLADLARAVITERTPLALERGIDLGLARAEAAALTGDADALHALLGNLVDNAIRYTPAGGKVDVEVTAAGGRPVLAVADTGPGIPAAERERVFDRFYRAPGNRTPGTGLGLAIVKSIAESHGARVELTDRPGGGLRAVVTFPAAAPG